MKQARTRIWLAIIGLLTIAVYGSLAWITIRAILNTDTQTQFGGLAQAVQMGFLLHMAICLGVAAITWTYLSYSISHKKFTLDPKETLIWGFIVALLSLPLALLFPALTNLVASVIIPTAMIRNVGWLFMVLIPANYLLGLLLPGFIVTRLIRKTKNAHSENST